ncbi:MAG: hypothetical protein AB1564_04350 [Chloroflexota bacterium]
MKVNLGEGLEFECFDVEEAKQVERIAEETNGVVYTWKTEGQFNWFQKGFTVVDTLGLAVLPKGLPDWIDLPDDEETS